MTPSASVTIAGPASDDFTRSQHAVWASLPVSLTQAPAKAQLVAVDGRSADWLETLQTAIQPGTAGVLVVRPAAGASAPDIRAIATAAADAGTIVAVQATWAANPAVAPFARAASERLSDVALIDSGRLEEYVRQVAPGGVSAALELVGARTLRDSLLTVAAKGVLCYMGVLGDQSALERFQPLSDIPSGVRLTSYASRATIDAAHCAHTLQQIVDSVEAGRYPTHLDHIFPFDEFVEAHRYMVDSHAIGKIVVLAP